MLPVNDLGLTSTHNSSIMDSEIGSTVSTTMDSMNGSNTTGPQPPYWSVPERVLLSIILIGIMLVSLVGNALVIISVAYFKDMQRKTYILIGNLAVADFGVSLLCMPFSLVTVIAGDWIFGDVLCAINGFLEAIFLIASIHGLMHISIHKYFQLSKPLRRVVDKKWATVMIVLTWIVAFTVAMAPVVGLTENEYKPGTSQCGPKFPEGVTGLIHAAYSVLMGFIIPWTVLGFCYGFIFRNIRKHGARMRINSSMGQRRVFQQQKRITVTLFIVFIVFFICWAPFIIFNIFGFTLSFDNIPIWPNVYCYWFGYLNSAINPVIYGWRNRSFRKAFREIRHCCNAPSTYRAENGTVPVNGRSSRRKRILNQPITPSSPDYVQTGGRRFRFERQVSHITLDGSRNGSKNVRFPNDEDSPLPKDRPLSPLTLILEDPPVVRKEGKPIERDNAAFVADDESASHGPFDTTHDECKKNMSCDQSAHCDQCEVDVVAYEHCHGDGKGAEIKQETTDTTNASEPVPINSCCDADAGQSSDEVGLHETKEDSELAVSDGHLQVESDTNADTRRRKSSLVTISEKILSTLIVSSDNDDDENLIQKEANSNLGDGTHTD